MSPKLTVPPAKVKIGAPQKAANIGDVKTNQDVFEHGLGLALTQKSGKAPLVELIILHKLPPPKKK